MEAPSSLPPPPSYDVSRSTPLRPEELLTHSQQYLGLPSGYFGIYSKATGRALDVRARSTEEGTEICLHTPKQPTLLRNSHSLRNPHNNQCFFLNWEGKLCSACADGGMIDAVLDQEAEVGSLHLAYPQPIFENPSRHSHPLPQFCLDPTTSTIQVLFACDPTFPGPARQTSWTDIEYVLESVPVKRKREAQGTTWSSTSNNLLSGFGLFGSSSRTATSPTPVPNSPSLSLKSNHSSPHTKSPSLFTSLPSPNPSIPEETDSDSDSEPNEYRPLRIVPLLPDWRDTFPSAALARNTTYVNTNSREAKEVRKWKRRQWSILPISVTSTQPVLPLPSALPSLSLPSLPSLPALPSLPPLSNFLSGPKPLHLARSATPASPQKNRPASYRTSQYYSNSPLPSGSGSGPPTTRAGGLDSEGDLEREWNGTDSAGSSSGRSSRPGSGASLSYSAYGGGIGGNIGERRSLGYTTTGNGNGVISPSLSANNGRGGERLSSGSELSSRLGEVREWDEDAKVLPSEEILTIIGDGPEEEELVEGSQVAVEEMLEMPEVSKHEQVEGVSKDVKAVEGAKADKEEAKEGEEQEEEGATPTRSEERNHSLPGSEGSGGGAVFDVSDYLVGEE